VGQLLGLWPGCGLSRRNLRPGAAISKTTEQVYKNIKVLKGIPAEQLIPAMQFVTASLGVQCDFLSLGKCLRKG
jgi:hypothetical protein